MVFVLSDRVAFFTFPAMFSIASPMLLYIISNSYVYDGRKIKKVCFNYSTSLTHVRDFLQNPFKTFLSINLRKELVGPQKFS